jgi:GT2 family glycosyltransferase
VSEARAPVAVVIVTRNSASFLDACLGSLMALTRRPAEIVVVDSGSSDGTPAILRRAWPDVRVTECAENVGFCRANNLGIRATTSPFVLVLNPDTRLEPDFVDRLLDALDDPEIGIAAGKLLRFDGATLDSAGQRLGLSRQPVDRGFGRRDRGQYDRDAEVFGACAAAALYRRALIDDVADAGGEFFDEAFFAYYEDLDVAWRAQRRGWRAAYRHRAVGYHLRGATLASRATARRFRGLLDRDPALRHHLVKNRHLTILRNDSPWRVLRDLPFILSRDLVMLGLVAATSPGVLSRLWRSRDLYARALARRRLDARRPRHHVCVGPGAAPGGQGGN